MTNLADLLPAGGGQNNTEFVADGNISAGAPVILTSDGKAAPIVSSAAAFGSEYEFESGITYYTVFNYNTTQDRVVAFYSDMSNGDYPTAVVGSISGSVITWGTPVVIISSAMSDYLAATYDANLDKHLVIFKSSSQGKALMGTVTAATNTISFGATETFSTDNVSNFDCMYDPSTTKSLIVWRDSGSSPASSAVVATPASDSTISFGSVLDWTYGSAYAQDICCAYDTNQNKVVVGAWEIPANYEIANYVATISGTSVTFGSRQQAYSTSNHHGYYNNTAMDYDKSANAIVNFWRESGAGKCIAGTISGDSISYGSATAVGSDTEMQHAIYSDQSSSIALSYFASSATYLQFFSTSGTTITVGSQITTDSAAWQYNANVYDPDTKAIIVGGADGGDSYKGKSKVYEQDPTNLTSTNLLGIAAGAISDTATGTINTWGSRNEAQSSLTIGSDYYVQTNGSIQSPTALPTYDLGTAALVSSFSVASQDTAPNDFAFNTDGTKMYVVGYTNDAVYQYSLSTAFTISTASYDSVSFSVASQSSLPTGLTFNNDGTKMYVVCKTNDAVYQYSLSSGFDLSTASYDSVSLDVSPQDNLPNSIRFNANGTKMYIVGAQYEYIFQYGLSSAFDLSTASYDSVYYDFNAQGTDGTGLAFSPDGTRMFIVCDSNNTAFQYSLSSGYDLSTVSYDSKSLTPSDTNPSDIRFSADGTKIFIIGRSEDKVFQYTTADVSTTYLIGKAITATQINIKDYTG